MTGFKSGASSDPYSGDDEDEQPDEVEESDASVGSGGVDDTQEVSGGTSPSSRSEPQRSTGESGGLPWIFRRSNARDDRVARQLHLQDETLREEGRFQSDVEDILGESVEKADLREAAYLVAMEHSGEVADQLREWGYDFE